MFLCILQTDMQMDGHHHGSSARGGPTHSPVSEENTNIIVSPDQLKVIHEPEDDILKPF